MEQKSRYKVLVADDSEMNRSILTDMLCRDMDVIEAKDGSEVLEILHRERKELVLVLLDLADDTITDAAALQVLASAKILLETDGDAALPAVRLLIENAMALMK